MDMNMDEVRRNQIIWGNNEARRDAERFEMLSIQQLETLIGEKFVNPAHKQNDAPSIGTLLKWAKKFPDATIHFEGYVISAFREDYRVSIDGITVQNPSEKVQKAFKKSFQFADSFITKDSGWRAWWD